MTIPIEKVNSDAREVAESSNVELFIRDITPIVERDSDQPLLGKSEKLTIHGKNVADEYLTTLLGKYDQDYSAVLDALRDVEREVRNDTEAPGNYELLQLVRCMRGKLVYNAHVVYVLEHYADEFPEKANVYTFLKEKGQPHKRHYSQSVYRAATVISQEKAEQADYYGVTEADELGLEARTEERASTLAQQNQVIVETDVGKSGWERVKGGLRRVGDWFSQNRREILQAGAVAAVVVAVSVFGHRTEKSPSFVTEQAKVVQPVELAGNPAPIAPETTSLENPVVTASPEVPQTVSPASVQAWEQGYNEAGEEILPPVVDATSGLEIPQEVPSKEVQDWYQEIDSEGTVTGGVSSTEDVQDSRETTIKAIISGDFRHNGELGLSETYIPSDLVEIQAEDIKATLWAGAGNHLISEKALPSLTAFIDECYQKGYTNLMIAHTYRSYAEQDAVHEKNPNGVAKAGKSQHQTGGAFDLYMLGDGGKLLPINGEIIDLALKHGIIHPLPKDTPHFFVLGVVYEGDIANVVGSQDPNKIINELAMLNLGISLGGDELSGGTLVRGENITYRKLTEEEAHLYRIVDRSNLLEANYTPEVVKLRQQDIPTSAEAVSASVEIIEPLQALFARAKEDGVEDIFIGSGYRSYATQKYLYDKAGDKRWTALPGSSQHQTGRAVDFTTRSINFAIDSRAGFENTPAYEFLDHEAYKFGFVRSYIDNNRHDGVPDESWHYYYVGVELATSYHGLRESGWKGDIFELLAWVNKMGALPKHVDGRLALSIELLDNSNLSHIDTIGDNIGGNLG